VARSNPACAKTEVKHAMSYVSFVKINGNSSTAMKHAIQESLELIGYSIKDQIQRAVIKPNLCYYWDYSTGQTTDPKFIAAMIEVIRERVSPETDISIVESDASAMKCKHAYKMLGYEKISQEYGVRLVNLSEEKSEDLDVVAAGQPFRIKVPNIIRDADLRISVPKIKYTMEEIKITCALKNIFGCNPYPKKFKYHPWLNEAIVALNKAMKFDLCVVDGNVVSGIQPRRLGLAMASTDPVAIDVAAAKIAGVNPRKIPYIEIARKEGLGQDSFVEKGLPLKYFAIRYPRKDVGKKFIGRAYKIAVITGLTKKLGLT